MTIRIMEDVGAPLAVTAVDIVMDSVAPQYSEWARYGMAGLGYVAGFMNWGGPALKNVGIAALPLAGRSIYDRVRGTTVSRGVRRLSYRPTSTVKAPVTRSYQPEFEPSGARAF